MNSKLKIMVETALITAIICVVAPFSIPLPFSPVPISFAMLAIYLGAYALDVLPGIASVLLYILIGLVGLPVFSNFKSGVGVIVGPTGGYIVGYIFIALFAGLFINKFEKKIWLHAIGIALGLAICYLLGTVWFLHILPEQTIKSALMLCVIPYLPADVVKIIIALIVGPKIRQGVKKINNK